ncbi:O-antigen ligase family protein [bacterium]|nr:O-antigen ligase family protein [bacterium]
MKSARRDNPVPPAETESLDRVLWILPAALCVGFVVYLEKAWPMENLGFCAVLGLTAFSGILAALIAGREWRARFLSNISRWPILSFIAFALYALARWSVMDVKSAGTEWVCGLLWMSVAIAAGVTVSTLAETSRPGGNENLLLYVRRFFIVIAILSAAHAFYQYFIGWERTLATLNQAGSGLDAGIAHALREKRVSGRLGNPNLFAAQLSMLAVFCVGSLNRRERPACRVSGAAGWLALAAALVLTASRGGMLTFALVTILGLAAAGIAPRNRRPLLCAFLAMATIAPVAAQGLIERIGNITTVRERLFYWDIAARIWGENPIFGGGPGRFALLYSQLKSPMARESQYAHSWLMQTGADLGLIGVVLYSIFWLGIAWMAWRAVRSERFWPLLALVALALNGLFEFTLQWRAFLVPAGLFAGLACGAGPLPASRLACARGIAAALLAACALLAASYISIPWQTAIRYEWVSRESQQDPAQAADALATASLWQPRDSSFVLNEARARMALRQDDLAASLLDRAARLNPYSAAVPAVRARLLIARNQPAGALNQIDKALDLYPSNLAYRMIKARLLISLNRIPEARDILESIERDKLPMYPEDRDDLDKLRVSCGLKPIGRPR